MLFVGWQQFGCHVDTYEYCRFLRDRFDITYLCVDEGMPRKRLDGVEVRFCAPAILGRIEPRLAVDTVRLLRHRRFDVVFVQRMKFGFMTRIACPSVPMVFDVRSGSIEPRPRARAVGNAWIRFNARFFPFVTAISDGLARDLRLPERTRIVPLGASPTTHRARPVRDELRLVYIGTFTGRCLDRAVDGLGRFRRRHPGALPATFSIVGFGGDDERAQLAAAVERNRLEAVVELCPRIDHDEVPEFISRFNVGIAFTPREPWYEHQPSTKVYEYLQSGLLCIATDSDANRQVVTDANGVLIDPTAEGFCRGLESVAEMLPGWRPDDVAATVADCSWERIVTTSLLPVLDDAVGAGRP